jgi:pimeloyl-ACP methyl ester carboxylesterase
MRTLADRQPPEAIIAALEALRDRPDRTSELAEIRCPALVLAGEQDRRTPEAVSRALADGLPAGRLQTIPGAGHLAPAETPRPVAAAIEGLLTEHDL